MLISVPNKQPNKANAEKDEKAEKLSLRHEFMHFTSQQIKLPTNHYFLI